MTEKTTALSVEGYEMIEKTVMPQGATSGRVYVPKAWIGKKVKIIRTEQIAKV
ncbi:MAG: DUF2080 family transposase-associated protein [Methanoregula sp.]|jgi:putative transposon-encoded protein|nr:DUF2080 family transposase-associated protein [Methanoregula sp.]